MSNKLEMATIFDNLMRNLWGDDLQQDFMIKAMADKLRGNARVNHENALDVLDIFSQGGVVASVHARGNDSDIPDQDHIAIFTVKFFDGSSVLIEAPRGIGSGVEVL